MSSTIRSSRVRFFLPHLAAIICLLGSNLTHAIEPHQILYKWDDANGRTHYTQTPPDTNIPYEEINSQQITSQDQNVDSPRTDSDTTSVQVDNNSTYATEQQTAASPRKESTSFSSIPENARVIPNKYHYSSTEYKVSPVNAARERARTD